MTEKDSLEHDSRLVADFLSRGGRIHRLPETVRVTFAEVVEYLRTQNIDVQRVGEGPWYKYVCRGQRVDEITLVSIANGCRAEQGLGPFQLKTPSSGYGS
jgi:hypothetical protein